MSNSFPNNKISDQFKLKLFADDKLNVTENLKFDFGNGTTHYLVFLLYPQSFQKLFFLMVIKTRNCMVKG